MTDATLQVLIARSVNPDTQTNVLDEAFHALRVEQYLHRILSALYDGESGVMGQ